MTTISFSKHINLGKGLSINFNLDDELVHLRNVPIPIDQTLCLVCNNPFQMQVPGILVLRPNQQDINDNNPIRQAHLTCLLTQEFQAMKEENLTALKRLLGPYLKEKENAQ